MVKIITDSSSNFTVEEAKTLGITLLPLTISFGTQEYLDGVEITCEEFYKKLASGGDFPHTSQLTEELVDKAVKENLKDGDEVLIMPLASVLSGSYERCKAVAGRYEGVIAYDTKCTTVMLKLCVLEALRLSSDGASAKEICAYLDGLRPKLKIYACLNTLENLRKGGRLSSVSALIGSVLNIKPVITFSQDGKVEMLSKQFGINKGISYIAGKVDKSKIDFTKPVYLIYTQNDKNSETLIGKLGVEYAEKCNICPVIGTHIGADAAGIVYAEK